MITEFLIKWIAGCVALLIFIAPIVAPVILLLRIVKRKGGHKNPSNNSSIYERKTASFPKWERVILDDGTEFWKIKGNVLLQEEQVEKQQQKHLSYKRKLLLTQAEYSFWQVLKRSCDEFGLFICPKVRMEDFIAVDEQDFSKKQSLRGRIKSRHIDFILCDNKLNVLAGIELDDNTHLKESIKEIDEFKGEVFRILNLPLYRVMMKNGYYEKQIQEILKELGYYMNDETNIQNEEEKNKN